VGDTPPNAKMESWTQHFMISTPRGSLKDDSSLVVPNFPVEAKSHEEESCREAHEEESCRGRDLETTPEYEVNIVSKERGDTLGQPSSGERGSTQPHATAEEGEGQECLEATTDSRGEHVSSEKPGHQPDQPIGLVPQEVICVEELPRPPEAYPAKAPPHRRH